MNKMCIAPAGHSKQTADSRPRAAADSRADGHGGRAGRRGGAAGGGRAASGERAADTDCSSTRSGRRHSVDTVSTYLSHESKDSLQQTSVGELLNCSGSSSDDVFEEGEASLAPAPAPPAPPDMPTSDGSIVGESGRGVGGGVCVGARGGVSPVGGAVPGVHEVAGGGRGGGRRGAVRGADGVRAHGAPGVPQPAPGAAARGRRAALHRLPRLRPRLRPPGGGAAARQHGVDAAGRRAAAAPALLVLHPRHLQVSGRASFARLPILYLCRVSDHTELLFRSSFQSGLQGPQHPVPGAPYYAVGFPRYTVLPDTPLGHQVLQALRAAWERGVLFTVCASQTTGREHVVAWRAPPPPAAPHHYAPPARPHHLLRDALARLRALLPSPAPMPASASLL
ncbi:hypothetical protein HW555_000847 [Spodoptera exigua]|uniref:E3 ubiquitin-protein ligase n=1 Tax=Spodoptera exigua TaxID=7107 RepID=A0A835LBM1_SPOEX|nr:hypothetical protein HW555_000847 [Spodoptera exigua]